MTKKIKRISSFLILAASFPAVALQASAPGSPEKDTQKVYLVSDAHLDTQWNWDIQTTIGEYVWNTLDRNLKLLEKYPNYIFNFEGGVKYSWMKEYYPREYELMKKYIHNGRWHICGASWDATDAIVPSVESAIRNVLLGQEFYRREFGVESTDIFLPDCFGFGWTLPTVAAHCGLIGFSSQKLGWRQNPFYGNKRYPFNVGLWKGVDGSEIMMAHGYNYGQRFGNEDLTQSRMLRKNSKENDLGVLFHYYGTGDVGGSPSLSSVDAVERAVGKEGGMQIISAASDQMFRDYLPYSSHPELPHFDGELLMDVHGTGCYTSQAAMKLYNRQNELLGDAAERASAAAELLGTAEYPSRYLTEAWQRFIFHQFHDDLTGTSIPRAYEFSWNDELLSLKQFSSVLTNSAARVASLLDTRVKGISVVIFNPLGHETTDVVEVEIPVAAKVGRAAVFNAEGKAVNSQFLGSNGGKARLLIEATVPANGFTVCDVRVSPGSAGTMKPIPAKQLENSAFRLSLDGKGDITSLIDKNTGKELVAPGKAIRLAVFTENESFAWPAWEILKKTTDATPVSIDGDVKVSLVENGPLRKTLCVEKKHGDSGFRQFIRLYEGELAGRIDFFNEVDWATTNALVKAEFPLAVSNETACYDLGLGTVDRGNNVPTAYEVYAQRWADLTDRSGSNGVTVLNDCKYGWDKPDDNTLRLTLLHTPKTDRGYSYQDHQDFGHHTFTYSIMPHAGKLNKAAASREADRLNQKLKAFSATKHPGRLGKTFSLASTDNPALAIKAFKKAESSGEYVVRVYETAGETATGKITFALPLLSASVADGTEETISPASFAGNTLDVGVKANGLATYKVTFKQPAAECPPSFAVLPVEFDEKCFSWNQFGAEAAFSGGFSYAAELLPDTVKSSGVPFRIENKAVFNGKRCKGDTIKLPAGNFNKLYILAATASEDSGAEGIFRAGKSTVALNVPSYTGFIGQWGHTGHTEGYLLDDEVAYVGTHRHSAQGDHPYDFTYMFKYGIDIPAGATEVVLPDNPGIVLFAATAANETEAPARALSTLFRTSILPATGDGEAPQGQTRANLLNANMIDGCSGHINEREHPKFLTDGDGKTKWCDVSGIPGYVDYDLGEIKTFGEWSITNAGAEDASYVTATCLLQVRNDKSEEWKTIDSVIGNKRNVVRRKLNSPQQARYIRLLVVQPEQSTRGGATRIYEFSVY